MAIKWQDIQNLSISIDEINLLAGLTTEASVLNGLDGYIGTAADLNTAITIDGRLSAHEALDFTTAHPIAANSLDGLIIADTTISKAKLSFDLVAQADIDTLQLQVADNITEGAVQQTQIDNLYAIVIPGQGADLADAILQTVAHIEKVTNVHDSSAISYGNYFVLPSDIVAATTTSLVVGSALIRHFRAGETVRFQDDITIAEDVVISAVDYNTHTITFPVTTNGYTTANNGIMWELSEDTVKEGLDRSLRNNTDNFTGRLTIAQASTNQALVIDKTADGNTIEASLDSVGNVVELTHTGTGDVLVLNGAGDELVFTLGTMRSAGGYSLDLADTKTFLIENDTAGERLLLDTAGQLTVTTERLREEGTIFHGTIDKQTLTADRTWTYRDLDNIIGNPGMAGNELKYLKANATASDTEWSAISAPEVTYDNIISGLIATDVKSAIDEIDGAIDTHVSDATIHRSINDAGISTVDLWSADKIDTELGLLALAGHTHGIDDLTDVDTTTASPVIGQILNWDGTNWVPTAKGEINTASNLSGGDGVFATKVGSDLQFKSLVGGTNTTLTADANTITVDVAVPASGEVNTASNVGGATGLFKQKAGSDLEFLTLAAGANITLAPVGDAIEIASTASGSGVGASSILKLLNADNDLIGDWTNTGTGTFTFNTVTPIHGDADYKFITSALNDKIERTVSVDPRSQDKYISCTFQYTLDVEGITASLYDGATFLEKLDLEVTTKVTSALIETKLDTVSNLTIRFESTSFTSAQTLIVDDIEFSDDPLTYKNLISYNSIRMSTATAFKGGTRVINFTTEELVGDYVTRVIDASGDYYLINKNGLYNMMLNSGSLVNGQYIGIGLNLASLTASPTTWTVTENICTNYNEIGGERLYSCSGEKYLYAGQKVYPVLSGVNSSVVKSIFTISINAETAHVVHSSELTQAAYMGSANWGTGGGTWTTGSDTWVDMPANVSATTPNVTGSVTVPNNQLPAIKIANAKPGMYKVEVLGHFSGVQQGDSSFRMSNGTTTFGMIASEGSLQNVTAMYGQVEHISGDLEIKIQATDHGHASGDSAQISLTPYDRDLTFAVYYFPTETTAKTFIAVPVDGLETFTGWTSYVPTFSAGFGAVTSKSGRWKRVGDSIDVVISGISGTTAASSGSISLPDSLNINSSSVTINNLVTQVGGEVGGYTTNFAAASQSGKVVTATATDSSVVYLAPVAGNASGHIVPASSLIAQVVGTGVPFTVRFTVPIQGWTTATGIVTGKFEKTRTAYIPVSSVASGYTKDHPPTTSYSTFNIYSPIGDTEFISVALNQVKLKKGKYEIILPLGCYSNPGWIDGRIYNATTSSVTEEFLNVIYSNAGSQMSVNDIKATFEIFEDDTLIELQSKATSTGGSIRYSRIKITKLR